MAVNIIPASLPVAANPFSAASASGNADERLRQLLMAKAMSTDPIQSPWQGAAQMAHALWLGMENNKARKQDAEATSLLQGLPGLGGGAPASPSPMGMPPPAAQPAPPPPSIPAPGPQSGMPPAPPPAAPPVQMASLGPDMPLPSQAPPPVQDVAAMTPDIPPQAGPAPASPPPQELARALASDGMPAPRPPAPVPNAAGPLPQKYIDQIKKFEGYTPKASWDYKQHSVGYGTRAKHAGEVIDRPEAERRLAAEVAKAAGIVDKFAPGAPEGPRAALTSLTYNAGDKWTRSGLGQLVKAGDWNAAKDRLLQYNKAGGQTLPGLASRRQAEAQWFNQSGAPQQTGQNVPLPRPRPPGAPQSPPPEMADAKVQLASLDGMPQREAAFSEAFKQISRDAEQRALSGLIEERGPFKIDPSAPIPQPENLPFTPQPGVDPRSLIEPMQMAQAQMQPQPQPQPSAAPPAARQAAQIPPDVANNIRALLANPKTRAYGMQLYQAYSKPSEPTFGDIGGGKKGWIDNRTKSVTPYAPPRQDAGNSAIPPAPPGVDEEQWVKEQTKALAGNAAPATREQAMQLRKELQDTPSYKNIAQSAPVYKSMLGAAGRDTRAADVNLIYGMAKIMDPASVVRESEMSVAQAIATLPQYLQAQIKSQMDASGRLSPDVRQAIMEEAHSRMSSYEEMYDTDASMFRGIAGRSKMNQEDVITPFGPFQPFKAPEQPPPAAGAAAPSQEKVINGKTYFQRGGAWFEK